MPPRPKVDESEVTGTYLKGSGPGGQKIVGCLSIRFFFFSLILQNAEYNISLKYP